jgi:hypothetical protein
MKTKTFKTKLAAMLLMALAFSFPVHAQVTIGSGLEPQRGALLDVKSKDAATPGGETTDQNGGGILMPRVELVDINSLEPFIAAGDQDAATKANHKGLVVYNLTDTGGFAAGPYSWDGTKWVGGADANDIKDYTGSTSIILNGTTITRAELTGDVTAGADSNTTLIANDAVNSAKIADGSILGEDIADKTIPATKLQGGPTAGQVLTSAQDGSVNWVTPRGSYFTQPTEVTGGTVFAGSTVLLRETSWGKARNPKREIIVSGVAAVKCLTCPPDARDIFMLNGTLDTNMNVGGSGDPHYAASGWFFLSDLENCYGERAGNQYAQYDHTVWLLSAATDIVLQPNFAIFPQ